MQADVFIAILLLKLQKTSMTIFNACILKKYKKIQKQNFHFENIIYALNCIVLLVFCSVIVQGVGLHIF